MNERETIFISEVKSGEIVKKEFYIVGQSGKKGLFDTSDPKCVVLPCDYEFIGHLDSNVPEYSPGITIKKDGLYGYFCNGEIIIPCEFNRIEVGDWNEKSMELMVERVGLKGLIEVDLTNNTPITRIPIDFQEIRYGNTLIACKNEVIWSIYSRPRKDKHGNVNPDSNYVKKGEFKTITTQYDEPYPVQDNKILLPLDAASIGIEWEEVDKIEEVSEGHYGVIRTIFATKGKFGLWDNRTWNVVLRNYDQLIPVKRKKNEWIDDCSLYMLAENGKAGVYNLEYSCFVLNPVYDKLSYLEGANTFLTSINGKQGILSENGNVLIPHLFERIRLLSKDLKKDYGEWNDDDCFYVNEFVYAAAIDGKLELYSQQGTQLLNKRYDKIEIEKTRVHHTESMYFHKEETLLVKVYEGRLAGLFIETDHGFLQVLPCDYDSIVYVPDMDLIITKRKNEIKHLTYRELIVSMKLKY